MGLGAILKRLFGRFFRGGETLPCTCCGASISRSDFEEGRAAVVARVRYCPKCVELVMGRSSGGVALDTSSSSLHGPMLG
jgi:hypothetical protein